MGADIAMLSSGDKIIVGLESAGWACLPRLKMICVIALFAYCDRGTIGDGRRNRLESTTESTSLVIRHVLSPILYSVNNVRVVAD